MESARAEAAAIGRAGRLAAGLARRLLGARGAPGRLGPRSWPATGGTAWERLVSAQRGPGHALARAPQHWTGLRLSWQDWMVLGRIRPAGPLPRTQGKWEGDGRGRPRDWSPAGTAAGGRSESRGVPLSQDAGPALTSIAGVRPAGDLSQRDGGTSRRAASEHTARPGGSRTGVPAAPQGALPAPQPPRQAPAPERLAWLEPGAHPVPERPRSAGLPPGPPHSGGPRPARAPDTLDTPAFRGPDLGMNLWGRLPLPTRILGQGFEWLHAASWVARVHDDARADRIARAHGAEAVTLGQEIFFRSGRLDPGSPRGLSLLAHELTHVWQQARPGGIRDAAEARRHEATLEHDAARTERAVARAAASADGTVPGSRTDPRGAPAPPALVLPAPAPARAEAAPRGAPAPAHAAPVLRAAEGRPGQAGGEEAGGPEVAEITAAVYRRLLHRMRIDQERLGVGRG